MRRGGRGYHLQVPWRQHDDPILSSTAFEQLEGHKLRLVIALVGFSTAILIFVWNSRRVVSSKLSDVPPRTTPRLVFPLYSHYMQSQNVSHDETWHQGSGANGRRLRTLSHPFFTLKEKFYIQMKLGNQAKTYNFLIDTGSKCTWVYCKLPGHKAGIEHLGPHGYFIPRKNAPIRCIGEDKRLCHAHQFQRGRPCDALHNFECLAWFTYEDRSSFKGTYILESFTLPTCDKKEVKGRGVIGCITEKTFVGEVLPLRFDGIVALGTCKNTIISEWMKSKLITNRRVGVCIGTPKPRQPHSSRIDFGYITAGVDLQEKFGVNHFGWAELINTEGFDCATIATLNYIILQGNTFYPSSTSGLPLVLDTGSEITCLDSSLYAQFINELDFHAMGKGYTTVKSDLRFQEADRRECWSAPKDTATSPLDDFPVITFCIKGVPNSIDLNPIQYLMLQPKNYLKWKENKLLLCSNIVQANTIAHAGESVLGSGQMRDHLFEMDPDNYRVRWQPDTCYF